MTVRWHSPPKTVGYYCIGNAEYSFRFALTKRPSWFHRLMTRWFLGWQWVDTKETSK